MVEGVISAYYLFLTNVINNFKYLLEIILFKRRGAIVMNRKPIRFIGYSLFFRVNSRPNPGCAGMFIKTAYSCDYIVIVYNCSISALY